MITLMFKTPVNNRGPFNAQTLLSFKVPLFLTGPLAVEKKTQGSREEYFSVQTHNLNSFLYFFLINKYNLNLHLSCD